MLCGARPAFARREGENWGELTFFKKQHTIAVFASPAASHQTARDLLARVVKLVDAGDSKIGTSTYLQHESNARQAAWDEGFREMQASEQKHWFLF
ncbi:hypothetical protein GCM10027287_39640 [Bordetella muralis]